MLMYVFDQNGFKMTVPSLSSQVMGLPPPIMVAEQELPDPDFPTVVFPNPEEGKGTWQLAFLTGVKGVSWC